MKKRNQATHMQHTKSPKQRHRERGDLLERLENRTLLSAGQLSTIFTPANTDFSNADTARGIVIQPDAKIVVAGTWDGGSADFAVARYNPDGSLDTTFGGGNQGVGTGKTNVTFGTGGNFAGHDFGNCVALQTDGKIVVAGTTDAFGTQDFAIARFNSDGSVDTTFNASGVKPGTLTIDFSGGNDVIEAIAIQPDGRIVVGGYNDNGSADFAAARINPDGSLDGAFGTSGKTTFTFGAVDMCTGLALQSDGKIVMVGQSNSSADGSVDMATARLNSNGSLDTTFNGTGEHLIGFAPNDNDFAEAVAIRPDGRILIAGYTGTSNSDIALVQFNTNGGFDPTFGLGGGFTITTLGSNDFATSLALQSDGKFVVGGYQNNGSGTIDRFALARFTAKGFLDTSFNGTGEVFDNNGREIYGTAVDGDGNIYVAGYTANTGNGDFRVEAFQGGEYAYNGTPLPVGQAFPAVDFNNGGEGVAYHDTTLINEGANDGPGAATRASGVDNETGFVNFVHAGEYVDYSLAVPGAGSYALTVHGGSQFSSGGRFHLEFFEPNGNTITTAQFIVPGLTATGYPTFTLPAVTLSGGIEIMRVIFDTEDASGFVGDFGTFQLDGVNTGAIRGTVYNDANGNGVHDITELPIGSGAQVYLDTNNNGVLDPGEPNIFASPTGQYTFDSLAAGAYHVRVKLPSTYTITGPAGGVWNINLSTGQIVTGTNFEAIKYARISGTVFNDSNGNGILNAGEPGLSAWTVFVDTNMDGLEQATEPKAITTSTGAYTFSNLIPGTYRLREVLKSGWKRTSAILSNVTVTQGQSVTGINFGNQKLPTTGTITGKVFIDANFNGAIDNGEAGLAGAGVYVDTNNNGVFDIGEKGATVTSSGLYAFSGLPAGTYFVRVQLPAGYGLTLPSTGVYKSVVAAGATVTDNFGATNKAIISGTIYFDANKDGIQNIGEPGLSNWGVFVDTNKNGLLNVGEPNMLTDAQGHFKFVLNAGTYVIREIVQSGFTPTAPAGKTITLTIKAGQVVTNANFGNH